MSLAVLELSLRQVPFLSTLGVRPEQAEPGRVVLRLPFAHPLANHAGALHTGAVFAVGELAAAVAIGSHPDLASAVQLQKSTKIKYYLACNTDVLAHVDVDDATIRRTLQALESGPAELEITVVIRDPEHRAVAELASKFVLRPR